MMITFMAYRPQVGKILLADPQTFDTPPFPDTVAPGIITSGLLITHELDT